jgi:hypothetical protein
VWVELTINNLDSSGHPFHLVGAHPLASILFSYPLPSSAQIVSEASEPQFVDM